MLAVNTFLMLFSCNYVHFVPKTDECGIPINWDLVQRRLLDDIYQTMYSSFDWKKLQAARSHDFLLRKFMVLFSNIAIQCEIRLI